MDTRRILALCVAGVLAAVAPAGCRGGRPTMSPVTSATSSTVAGPPGASGTLPPVVSPVGSATPASGPSGGGPGGSRSPTGPPAGTPTASTGPTYGQQTLSGQVQTGVEPGCLVLRDATGTYQLLGGDPTVVYPGAWIIATGHVVTGVMSYCMQGRPFQVVAAQPRP